MDGSLSDGEDLGMAHFHHDSSMGITGIGHSKSQMKLKPHHWFKSYGDFAEWADFSYWTKW